MAWKFHASICTSLDKYYWNVSFQCGCATATARALPQVAETLWVWCCIPDPVAGVGQKPALNMLNLETLWAVSLSQLPSWQTGQFPSCSTSHPGRRRTWPKKNTPHFAHLSISPFCPDMLCVKCWGMLNHWIGPRDLFTGCHEIFDGKKKHAFPPVFP